MPSSLYDVMQNAQYSIISDSTIECHEKTLYDGREIELPLQVNYEITPIKLVLFTVYNFSYIDENGERRNMEGNYELDISKFPFEINEIYDYNTHIKNIMSSKRQIKVV